MTDANDSMVGEFQRWGFVLPEGGVPSALGLENLYDFADHADTVLQKPVRELVSDFYSDEITGSRTRFLFDSLALLPRYLVDVGDIDTSTTALGHEIVVPLVASTLGNQTAFHPRGELASCRAANEVGGVGIFSFSSDFTLEQAKDATDGPLWCEIALLDDRSYLADFIARAEDLGFDAFCWTVDYDLGDNAPSIARPGLRGRSIDASASFADIDWLRGRTKLPLVIKGVLHPDDARACVNSGADGIVVANHRLRVVDGTVPALQMLAEVADAVAGAADVFYEGGVRRGLDVLKAIALGARAVLIGRPVAWGLAAAGEDGAARVLKILAEELEQAMRMTGARSISDLSRDLVVKVPTLFETDGRAATRQESFSCQRRPGSVVSRHYSRSSRWRELG
jgi:4-hydroxymandelate oxidase